MRLSVSHFGTKGLAFWNKVYFISAPHILDQRVFMLLKAIKCILYACRFYVDLAFFHNQSYFQFNGEPSKEVSLMSLFVL